MVRECLPKHCLVTILVTIPPAFTKFSILELSYFLTPVKTSHNASKLIVMGVLL